MTLNDRQFGKHSPGAQDPDSFTRGGPNWTPSPGKPWSEGGHGGPVDISNTSVVYSRVHRLGGKPDVHWLELHNHTTEPPFEGWERKEPIGQLTWDSKTGRVFSLHTKDAYRGLGVATHLWEHANRMADLGMTQPPQHSNNRTTGGDAFARSVGGRLPRNKPAKSDWSRLQG